MNVSTVSCFKINHTKKQNPAVRKDAGVLPFVFFRSRPCHSQKGEPCSEGTPLLIIFFRQASVFSKSRSRIQSWSLA